jgi:predicted nucleotide-binding protein
MQCYHVYILHVDNSGNPAEAIELDFSEEDLKARIVEPYLAGQDFICSGQPVNPFKVKAIRISQSEELSMDIIPRLDIQMYLYEDLGVVESCPNVTKKFITHPPRKEAESEIKKNVKTEHSKDIFIVHGTDFTPVKELIVIIKESGLNPVVLHEQPSKGMTLIEKLEKYSNVGFAVIILTPDDNGLGKKDVERLIISAIGKEHPTMDDLKNYLEKTSPEVIQDTVIKGIALLRDRARQNVVLEFGYFMGKLSRERICCLYKGNIELPSDMQGICYVHFDNSVNEVKAMILKELREAGYETKV